MGIFRSHTTISHPQTSSSPSTYTPSILTDPTGAIVPKDAEMSVLRRETHHLTSKFHKSPSAKNFQDEPELGISRSHTDPLNASPGKESASRSSKEKTTSGHSSGTSSPHRHHSTRPSLDTFRNLRERPTSIIPGLYLAAEQVHRYKMRTCQGMQCTPEETAEIKKMNHWTWKKAGRPGEAKMPVGPRGESWHFEGVAEEQVGGHVSTDEVVEREA